MNVTLNFLQLLWILLGIFGLIMLIRGFVSLTWIEDEWRKHSVSGYGWLGHEIISLLSFLAFFGFPYYWDSLSMSPTTRFFLGIELGGTHATQGDNLPFWAMCMKITISVFICIFLFTLCIRYFIKRRQKTNDRYGCDIKNKKIIDSTEAKNK